MKKEAVTKEDLNKVLDTKLEEHSRTIISAIETEAVETRRKTLEAIDRIENSTMLTVV